MKIQKNSATKWQAVVLPKIQPTNPNDTFTTQGEKVEWGTPEISGSILRSDAAGHPMDSEADAEAAIKKFLGITGEQ